MIGLLSRLLIPNREDGQDPAVRRAYGALCGGVGTLLNLILFAGKLLAGLLSGSIAVTADAFNNLSDAASSLVTFIGFRVAGRRDDREHPFGHGRAEYIAGLIVALVVLWMGLELALDAARRILNPQVTMLHPAALIALGASLPVKLYMFAYNRRIGRRIESPAMDAAAMDSLGDACADLAVLAGMVIAKCTGLRLDGWLGLGVAGLILWGGVSALRESVSPLLGVQPKRDFVARVEAIAADCPKILGLHDLRVHEYGPGRVMVSLHAEVPADGSLVELHDAIDAVERRLKAELGCEAVIHMDPVSAEDEEIAALHGQILSVLRAAVDGRIELHDFRAVRQEGQLRVSFDALIPYDVPGTDEALAARVKAIVEALGGDIAAQVAVDRPYGEG